MENIKSINPIKIQAAILIAYGTSHKNTAKKLNKSPQTISKYLQDPEVVALINRTKRTMMEETIDMKREPCHCGREY